MEANCELGVRSAIMATCAQREGLQHWNKVEDEVQKTEERTDTTPNCVHRQTEQEAINRGVRRAWNKHDNTGRERSRDNTAIRTLHKMHS